MGKGIIGENYTFTVRFITETGVAMVPDSTKIYVFYYNAAGEKYYLVNGLPMLEDDEVARYKYTIVIPSDLTESDQIYATMIGEYISQGFTVSEEEHLDIFPKTSNNSSSGSTASCSGLRTSFIKPR